MNEQNNFVSDAVQWHFYLDSAESGAELAVPWQE
jgi:hypothetical protein